MPHYKPNRLAGPCSECAATMTTTTRHGRTHTTVRHEIGCPHWRPANHTTDTAATARKKH